MLQLEETSLSVTPSPPGAASYDMLSIGELQVEVVEIERLLARHIRAWCEEWARREIESGSEDNAKDVDASALCALEDGQLLGAVQAFLDRDKSILTDKVAVREARQRRLAILKGFSLVPEPSRHLSTGAIEDVLAIYQDLETYLFELRRRMIGSSDWRYEIDHVALKLFSVGTRIAKLVRSRVLAPPVNLTIDQGLTVPKDEVFISCQERDNIYAESLVRALEVRGIHGIFYPHHAKTDYDAWMFRRIVAPEVRALVVLHRQAVWSSPPCRREIFSGVARTKRPEMELNGAFDIALILRTSDKPQKPLSQCDYKDECTVDDAAEYIKFRLGYLRRSG